MIRLLLALALVLATAPTVMAREEIRAFDVVLEVQTDGAVTITETITVSAEGNEIRRGIFRDIPTTLSTPDGRTVRMPLAVVSVTRNGAAEPYALEGISGGQRIRIGAADALLSPGVHRYEIVYTMERAARMFADHDELYWNATGNYWAFPINAASALVVLPPGAAITELNVYTGAQGVAGVDAEIERLSANQARFTMERGLSPYEGMTVSVAFEKGVLTGPQGTDAVIAWFSDYRDYIVPAVLLVIALGYNGLAWNAVGRDPEKGVIFPRFHPPQGFSPALVHYVHRMGWQNNGWLAFSAALVSLAVKGLLGIEKAGKKTVLKPTGRSPAETLPPSEETIFDFLKGRDQLTIDEKTGPALDKTRRSLLERIEAENRSVYFNNHVIFVVFGVLLALASVGAMLALGIIEPLFVFVAGFGAVFVSLLAMGLRGLWLKPNFGAIVALGILGFFVVNMGTLALDRLTMDWLSFPLVATVSIFAITLIFGILMRAPTVHGRKVMDEIDGFRMYLETAEKERLNFQGEPEMTVSRFEAILPYAMALGVEKPWSERFQNDLARHAVRDAGASYAPHWYAGQNFSANSLARAMGGVAAGLSSAMIAAQPSSSSSSGTGGGGFSGGGGGGGGGGGW